MSTTGIAYHEETDSDGNKVIDPSKYKITLPPIQTRIGHVFQNPVDHREIESPEGFAANVGIIGHPFVRTFLQYIPEIDYHRIRRGSF
jgi:hypothetical protein